ncbi:MULTISPECIES: fimbrial protein [Xenorhabdus]|uniref:fimbrial protein n=1 Tax=Xenorhabdus TaxID=626 RepID=UPI000689783C|nr:MULTISPECIES: fimbrial protein [Xenorhabdus]MBC8945038.1 putative major fimbrial subunit [Xenorhabdus indica]
MFNVERNNRFQIKANNFLLALLIIIVAGSYSTRVTAAVCTANNDTQIITFGDISVDYNETSFPYRKTIFSNGNGVKCSKYNQNIYVKDINGIKNYHKNNFYNTSLSGVRFKWSLKPNDLEHAEMRQGSVRGIGKEKTFESKFYIEIDDSVQSGKVNEIKIMMARQDEKRNKTEEILYEYIIPAFNVTARTCKITTPVVNVPMGTVLVSQFKNRGNTVGGRSFDINVQCKGSPNASIIWEPGKTDTNGVINADSTSSATGIGIQILDSGGKPVIFNQPQDLGTINSSETLSYMAKYYQTHDRVSAGSVNATATFTINYK